MTKSTTVTLRGLLLGVFLATSLSGCGWDFSGDVDNKQPDEANRKQSRTKSAYDDSYGSIFGEDGLTFFGGEDQTASVDPGIGVNSYLWRASLDTIAFMPLTSADPFGGVLITDWYTPPATPNERLKVTVYILSRDLRADGIKATVFRQSMVSGQWVDQAVDQKTATDLEDAILTRARQLRIGSPTG